MFTPLSSLCIDTREFLVKRDDLIDPYLAGNKYRKLYTLLHTPKEKYQTLISYGGTQSNAMLAIAALCQKKNWQFIYYTKPLSSWQKENLGGNYAQAVALGMKHKEVASEYYKEFIATLALSLDSKSCLLHQGGADRNVQEGVASLAQEIRDAAPDVEALATPSGTGTTALYLAKSLPEYTLYTTALVGDTEYLKEQMRALEKIPENLIFLEPQKRYHFAKPYKEFYEVYKKLFDLGIEFDLIYAPLMWKMLLEQTKGKVLYIHSGGTSGNATMLQRYRKKALC